MPLYVVATPIGNLQDITLRAVDVLRQADLIAAEDTRTTCKLLRHYKITTPLRSYHEHNEAYVARLLLTELKFGKSVALVSESGTPLVSDPGYRIVRAAIEEGVEVIPIPGPSALLAGLSVSGLPAHEFTFRGFLPRTPGARKKEIRKLAEHEGTLIFYESPHRIRATLADALEALGDRPAVLCRELTKLHEQILRGSLSELLGADFPERGEFVLLISGKTRK